MPYVTTLAGLSDIGRARSRNEDTLTLVPDTVVAVVADGMGGHPGGDIASRVAARTAAEELSARLGSDGDVQDAGGGLGAAMAESVMRAHDAVLEEGTRDPSLEGMGTTLTVMAVDPATGGYALGHVGDSRAYLYRGGELVQLTRDDTWVQERVEANELTLEQARSHPFGHILTQCIGLEEGPEPHVLEGTVEVGDAYLLCTDGLVGMLDDQVVAAILSERLGRRPRGDDAEAAAAALVAAANEAGGYDNVTVALLIVEE